MDCTNCGRTNSSQLEIEDGKAPEKLQALGKRLETHEAEMEELRKAFAMQKLQAEQADRLKLELEEEKRRHQEQEAEQQRRDREAEQLRLNEREKQEEARKINAQALEPESTQPLTQKGSKASKLQHHKEKAKKLLVRHVNPKFIYFDKPFLLAIIVGLAGWALFTVIFWQLMINCSYKEVSKAGAITSHLRYIVHSRKSGYTMCLNEATFFSSYESDLRVPVLRESRCQPPDWFLTDWPESLIERSTISKEDMQYTTGGVPWCQGASGPVKAACEREWGGTCPSCAVQAANSSSTEDEMETVLNGVYGETNCPVPSQMFGVALSYAQQLEVLITVVAVFSLMAARVLHQHGPNGKEGLCESMKAQAESLGESVAENVGTAATNDV